MIGRVKIADDVWASVTADKAERRVLGEGTMKER